MTVAFKNPFVTILLTAAFLQSVVANYNYGSTGSYVQFDTCACTTSDLSVTSDDDCDATENFEGSQARTWQNLCAGSRGNIATNDDDDAGVNNDSGDSNGETEFFNIDQRVGDPFRKLCQLIGQYPNVRDYLGRGYSPHTIFAPVDSAFNKVAGIVGQIDEQKLLEIHILPEARLTYDLHCGQTVRTLNTDNLPKNNQKTKTKCVTGGLTQQLGPGNYKAGHKPTIGSPNNIFNAFKFQNQDIFDLLARGGLNAAQGNSQNEFNYLFSKDVISCNGIIQVVDNVILPGNSNQFQSSGYGGGYGGGGGYYQTYRSGYYSSGKGNGKGGGKGGYYSQAGKGGYYSQAGKGGYYSQGKGGYYSQGKGGGGYYNSGKGFGKGNGKGMGKGIGRGGKGAKGSKGYGYGGKGQKGGKGYGGYGGYGGGYGGGYYRRDLENENANEEGDFGNYEAEYADFLSPDFDESEHYGYDEDEDEEDYFYDEEEEDSGHVGRFAAEAEENENEESAGAAATAEKFKNRKRRLEALLEPNGNIAAVAE